MVLEIFEIALRLRNRYIFMRQLLETLNAFKTRTRHQKCSVKKVFLEISQNSQENTCMGVSFFTIT